MIRWSFFASVICAIASGRLLAEEQSIRGEMLIIQGEAGTDEYGEQFSKWANRWVSACEAGIIRHRLIAPDVERQPQGPSIQEQLAELSVKSQLPLWIVLIGHGTFDGKTARFNLVGPDLSSHEFADGLNGAQRPVILINCSSASAPFIEDLSAPNRVVMTATRSGDQVSFSRFGEYLSLAITDLSVDLDKDGQVSLLEGFLSASRQVQDFYEADGRIATENALIDDNGDGLGTRASAFRGLRQIAESTTAETILDGFRAHQFHLVANEVDRLLSLEVISERNAIEAEIEKLRLKKADIPEDQYYEQLEELFLKLAALLLPEDAVQHETTRSEPSETKLPQSPPLQDND